MIRPAMAPLTCISWRGSRSWRLYWRTTKLRTTRSRECWDSCRRTPRIPLGVGIEGLVACRRWKIWRCRSARISKPSTRQKVVRYLLSSFSLILFVTHHHDKIPSILELAQAQTKITKLEESIATFEQQLWEAGVAITHGHTVPRTGPIPSSSSSNPPTGGPSNVLHMQASPASEHFALRKQELARLKEENAALVKRVGELERGILGGEPGDEEALVPRKTWENACVEKAELTGTIAQKELRLLRLQQVRSRSHPLSESTSIGGLTLILRSHFVDRL